jgi:ABC-type polysaccharide/polyol phosphate transport system ATPase subunit
MTSSGEPFVVEATSVSKAFRLPHQQRTTIKEHFLHPFARTQYERQQALNDVSFAVRAGEFFGIIGPNGSGKSTLLKILAGIYRQDSGVIRIAGRLSPFIELGVGFNMELNARDNVRINGTLLGLSPSEVTARFDDIIEFAGLERFVDQQLKNYSSGMMLRLAYSIAIQVEFDILLLDEVLAVGDQSFQESCFATFERFRDEQKTIVFVSHDLASVSRFCDRTLFLLNGSIQGIGPTDEILGLYQSSQALVQPVAS